VLVAAVQLCSGADRARNLATATALVERAAGLGARLAVLPEMWPFIGPDAEKVRGAETLDGPSVTAMRELARRLAIWLVPGSFAERSEQSGKVHNTVTVLDPQGEIRSVYRKIHLFDVDIPGGAQFRESETVAPGDEAVVADTDLGRIGLSVCYDLRFPLLYEQLCAAGAEIVLVPAAFTAHTGKDHWEVLLRARAIEQQVWVLAPDQWGRHDERRQSHGHSMVIDPWGHVVARAGDADGVVLAELDLERLRRVRAQLPVAEHRRPFAEPRRA
jgi:predicted amidohydrolase